MAAKWAAAASDDEEVEDLVVAEDPRVGVGALGGVDDGARRVEEAAGGDEQGAGRPHRVPELGEGDDGDPAERQVDQRRDPLRVVDPDHLDDRAGDRADPDDDQDRVGERAVEDEQGEGRVGAGDEEEDHRVIEPAHPAAHVGPGPVDPVIEGAGAEQGREADRVDRHREGRLRRLGGDDQAGAEEERDEEGPLVRDAAQLRLDRGERILRGVGSLAHRLSRGTRSLAHPFRAPAQIIDHAPKGTPPLCRDCGIATM